MATSPCKLVRHLVASGDHVAQNAPYAEVEVMKMMMPLLAPAAGVIRFELPEGAALGAGDLVATLEVRMAALEIPCLGLGLRRALCVVLLALRLDRSFGLKSLQVASCPGLITNSC